MNSLAPSPTPTSLKLFLDLYSKAERECNLNYMEGAKALHAWLTSPEYPVLTFTVTRPVQTCPSILGSYKIGELAGIITDYRNDTDGIPFHTKLATCRRAEAAIIEYYIAKWKDK